ncbi:MAG: serine/threonine protein kinase [Phycisphaerales bacterium]|nr:MAG: serine/threonine protein kinase [Phycisphaerales bacterium]
MFDRSPTVDVDDPGTHILRVLEDVTARRLAGEEVADESVISAYPELMPELGSKLHALRLTEQARRIAADSGTTLVTASNLRSTSEALPVEMLSANVFRGYEIRAELGRGAMGVVYRALQTATERQVAVKVMVEGPFAGAHDRARFQREARILGQLRHPNIVTIHDSGVAAGRFFMVMDYVAGPTLDVHLDNSDYSIRKKLELFGKVCEAVHAAHLRGIIHRDLKPSNIRIDADGEPRILDFGLAKAAPDDARDGFSEHSMTMTGQFVGSLPWASPEQAEGAPARIDLRTDVYSLGVMLYQIIASRFPYSVAGHLREVINNILQTDPDKPSKVVPSIDDDVDTIVLKSLAKEPDRRYQSAMELARDIRHYLAGEPIDAKRDSAWYVFHKSVRRHKAPVAVAAGFVLLLVGFGVTMSVMYHRAEREADRARRTLTFLQDMLFEASSQRLGPDATLLQVLDEASARISDQLSDQPAVAAAIQYTIGHAYDTVWRQEEAARHLRAALHLYVRAYGPEHPDTLRAMVLLGMVLGELRDPEAVELQQEALAKRRKLYGAEHVLVAESKNELAYAYWRTASPRRWDDAERHYHEALALYRRLLGDEHPDIARCLFAYGAMQHVLGRYDQSESLFSESLIMSRKLLGEEHQFTVECMLGYSDALQQLGRYEEAEAMLRRLLALAPRRFGRIRTPGMMRRLAGLYLAKGALAAAKRWQHESIAVACRQLSESSPADAEQLNRFATLFAAQRSTEDSLPPYREALALIAERSEDSTEAAQALLGTASLLTALERADHAEPLLRETVQLVKTLPTENRIFTQYAAGRLGDSLTTLGRYEEAEPILLESHAVLHNELTYSHPLARTALQRLISLYEAWGRPDEVEPYRKRLGEFPADTTLSTP